MKDLQISVFNCKFNSERFPVEFLIFIFHIKSLVKMHFKLFLLILLSYLSSHITHKKRWSCFLYSLRCCFVRNLLNIILISILWLLSVVKRPRLSLSPEGKVSVEASEMMLSSSSSSLPQMFFSPG